MSLVNVSWNSCTPLQVVYRDSNVAHHSMFIYAIESFNCTCQGKTIKYEDFGSRLGLSVDIGSGLPSTIGKYCSLDDFSKILRS
jgi:hypothetical protein